MVYNYNLSDVVVFAHTLSSDLMQVNKDKNYGIIVCGVNNKTPYLAGLSNMSVNNKSMIEHYLKPETVYSIVKTDVSIPGISTQSFVEFVHGLTSLDDIKMKQREFIIKASKISDGIDDKIDYNVINVTDFRNK